ncbi:uncharacterized protein BCR38DRAFT_334472, partial [Pseudomassariella vexata]
VLVPYIENPGFFGRSEILNDLRRQLGYDQHQGANKPRSRVSLYGLGGVGKTQIALAYVYWLQYTCPDISIFWVHASNEGRFREAFASIAQKCNIPGYNDPKVDVLLLVKTWGKRPIEIGRMTDGEASQLLRTILEDTEIPTEETSLLSTRLEHLPLALAQAAAFIQENDVSIRRYVQLLDQSDSGLVDRLSEPFETVGRDSETPHALTETWIISFEQIERQNAFASEVLSLISLLDRQAIPEDFVVNYWCRRQPKESGENKEAEVVTALGTLKAFSFISEDKHQSIDMHRLVQLVTRKWLVEKGRTAEFAQYALETISNIYPYGRFETREACLKYLPHAYAVLRSKNTSTGVEGIARASLLHCVAAYLLYSGQWEGAEKHQLEATNLRKAILGEDHADTLTSIANLASTYRNQGRWEEAEKLEVQVMETRKTKLGADHPDTLTSMANLASTYRNQGRWEEAEKLEVQVMETSKTKLGADHPDTLTSMANLAFTWKDQGRHADALALIQDCSLARDRVLGPEHPDTLSSLAAVENWS